MIRTTSVTLALVCTMLVLSASPVHADMDCDDLSSHAEAQDYFEANGGNTFNNVDRLDRDGDGLACELGPESGYSSSTSSGGRDPDSYPDSKRSYSESDRGDPADPGTFMDDVGPASVYVGIGLIALIGGCLVKLWEWSSSKRL